MKNLLFLSIVFGSLLIISCSNQKSNGVLVFSKTEGFRHESIEAGIGLIQRLGEQEGFEVTATEDASHFTTQNLKNYKVVVFLNTTGDVFDRSQEQEFRRFIQAGGGFVGVHAAADTEYEWPWYGQLVGGYFNGHPNNPNVRDGSIDKTEHRHISTDHLPDRWDRTDEWYNYKSLNPNITSVLNLDETSYEGGTNGEFHPIAWYHEFDGGRSFYTGGGHTDESYEEENFVRHLLGGIQWAMGDQKAVDYNLASVMPEENRFQKEELDSYFNEPMELDLLPDGRIVFIERKGAVRLYDPALEATKTLTTLDVYTGEEDGLIGMAIDPNYSDNSHIFLCYSHPEETHQSISRFTFDPDGNEEEVLSDEVVVLKIETQRDECCHSGGSIEFDHNGYLWGSFGDNTNPHQSSGFSPSDERPGRAPFDAQKSSSNTNDLRGKIIRIKVNPDGSYDIPDGNLFPKDGSQGRPEIYVMGCRNPFRFSIDSETNYVYWGEIGPDARDDGDDRGPRGYDEVNQAREPGFFGWPYFIGDNKAYNDYDFATETSSSKRDPANPINDSPNNTGIRELPPAQEAMIYYPYAKSEEFPYTGSGGRNAMAGPVYHEEKFRHNPNRFPAYYDDKLFIYDWMRGWMMAVTFDDNGDMAYMEPFLPSIKWNNLMDVVLSPDGDLYTLEYGTGWFTANENAILSHLKYNPGNRVPKAELKVNETAQAVPFTVQFDAQGSMDSDGDKLSFDWDFGDGNTDRGASVEHTYTEPGEFMASVKVTDGDGESSSEQVKILAGNTPPEVNIQIEGNSRFYFPGQPINYTVLASDKEDGTIDPDNIAVTVDYLEMGHDMTSIAQGHMALSQIKSSHPGQDLISQSDCVSCHKIDGLSVGPSYKSISEKYLGQRGRRSLKESYLAEKIIKGGGGVWGETAMAAHPDISPKDANQMAKYILSVGEKKKEVEIPAFGSHVLQVPEGNDPGGKFVIMASYTDKGNGDVEPLRSFDNLVLQPATLSAVAYTSGEFVSQFTITPDMFPGIEQEFEIAVVNDNAVITYEAMDLTGIGSVILTASAPGMFASGGSFDIYLDDPESEPIYSGEIKVSMQMGAMDNIPIPLAEHSGIHDLIVKFKSNKEGAPVGTLAAWTFLPMSGS